LYNKRKFNFYTKYPAQKTIPQQFKIHIIFILTCSGGGTAKAVLVAAKEGDFVNEGNLVVSDSDGSHSVSPMTNRHFLVHNKR
jgi:hypothetical protein